MTRAGARTIPGSRTRRIAQRRLLVACTLVVLLGVAVLAWRLQVFGRIVPLPMLVKGDGVSDLPGLVSNLRWLRRLHGPLPPLAAMVLLASTMPGGRRRLRAALVPGLLVATLLVPLASAHQLQNVLWRFQAPVVVALAIALVQLATRHPHRRLAAAALIVGLVPSAIAGGKQAIELVHGLPDRPTEPVAAAYAEHLTPDDLLVVTEAGLLPHWTGARVVDLVGLNTTRFATARPRVRDLTELDPTAVSFHTYGVVDPDALPSGEVTAAMLGAALRPGGGPAEARLPHAARTLARWLAERPAGSWRILTMSVGRRVLVHAVRYGETGDAVARDWNRPVHPSYDALRTRHRRTGARAR